MQTRPHSPTTRSKRTSSPRTAPPLSSSIRKPSAPPSACACRARMADEHPEIGAYSPEHYGGSPVTFYVHVENCDGAFQRAIAAGGISERDPADMPYGDRVAGVLDPFGYKWYLAARLPPPGPLTTRTEIRS